MIRFEHVVEVPDDRIGRFIRKAANAIGRLNSRKFGRHRRGRLILSRVDGDRPPLSDSVRVRLVFRNACRGYSKLYKFDDFGRLLKFARSRR